MDTEARRIRLASDAIVVDAAELVRRTARRVALSGLAAAIIVPIANAFGMSPFPLPLFETMFACLVASAIAGVAMLASGRVGGRPRSGTIDLGADCIEVRCGDVKRYRLADLEQGAFCEPNNVVLRLRSGLELCVRLARVDADSLLYHAGLSARQRVLRVPVASAASQRRGGQALAVLGMVLVGPLAFLSTIIGAALLADLPRGHLHFPDVPYLVVCVLVAALGALALRALAAFLGRREVVVGADGIAIEARSRRKFVSYEAMARVTGADRGVILELRDGSSVELPLQVTESLDALARRELLLSRIADAMASIAAGSTTAHLDLLDQGARPVEVWRAALRALVDRPGSYRGGHLTSDQLLAVVADVRASPERRVAASVALSATDDEEHRSRIRAAAQACADDELRAAMEHAAEGEIDEAALARIGHRSH
jgi:hypothetical protein